MNPENLILIPTELFRKTVNAIYVCVIMDYGYCNNFDTEYNAEFCEWEMIPRRRKKKSSFPYFQLVD